jgi:hypothetical protein
MKIRLPHHFQGVDAFMTSRFSPDQAEWTEDHSTGPRMSWK